MVSYFAAPVSIKFRFHSLEIYLRILLVVAVLLMSVVEAVHSCACVVNALPGVHIFCISDNLCIHKISIIYNEEQKGNQSETASTQSPRSS